MIERDPGDDGDLSLQIVVHPHIVKSEQKVRQVQVFLPVGLMPQVDNIVTVRFHPFGVDRDITKLCSVLPNVPFSAIVGQHPHL